MRTWEVKKKIKSLDGNYLYLWRLNPKQIVLEQITSVEVCKSKLLNYLTIQKSYFFIYKLKQWNQYQTFCENTIQTHEIS